MSKSYMALSLIEYKMQYMYQIQHNTSYKHGNLCSEFSGHKNAMDT